MEPNELDIFKISLPDWMIEACEQFGLEPWGDPRLDDEFPQDGHFKIEKRSTVPWVRD